MNNEELCEEIRISSFLLKKEFQFSATNNTENCVNFFEVDLHFLTSPGTS